MTTENLSVGDRVKFIGPSYDVPEQRYPTLGWGTFIGCNGERRRGHKSQKWGEEPVELVTVMFDGDDRPTVLDINRLEVL